MTELAAYRSEKNKRVWALGGALGITLVIIATWRLTSGEWPIPPSRVAHLLSPWLPEAELGSAEALVVRSVRLPRLLSALGAGGTLGVSGVILQGLLSNPLAEPYTLGIAAGAALGGTLGLLFGAGPLVVTPGAFLGALLAVGAVGVIAWLGGAPLVLAGIVANAMLSAGVTFLKAIAGDKLGAVVLWLMGSLAGASPASVISVWIGLAVTLLTALLYAPMLDAMSLGRGALLGVNEGRVRNFLLAATSLGTAAVVSSFGIIGFVGLVVPHLLRLYIGSTHRPLLLLSCLAGGCLLTGADGIAQSLGELPVGVLTALLGGPFFCWLLVRRGRR